MLGPSGSAHQIDRLLVFGALLADYRLISRQWLWVLKSWAPSGLLCEPFWPIFEEQSSRLPPGYLTL